MAKSTKSAQASVATAAALAVAASSKIQLTAVIGHKNKDLEQKLIDAAKVSPVERKGGRTTPRELTFDVADQKSAINMRMRIYLHMKKLGEEVKVHIAGLSYAKTPSVSK